MRAKRFMAIGVLTMLCLFLSCKKHHHTVIRGFYYWKTVYKPTAYEHEIMGKLQVRKMYTRLLDIDLDPVTHQPIPIAPIQFPTNITDTFEFVPVVFITQQTLAGLNEKDILPLAIKTASFIASLRNGYRIQPKEIQIDCDWTAGTKDIYFKLLGALKQQAYFKDKILSCTLRMHQVKFATSSGIPPVDKAMLMCYSMGDIKKPGERNSILDVELAKDYLHKIDLYPLPLDIALPVFQWCILFRGDKYRGIMHDVTPDMVTGSPLFDKQKGDLYTCKTDTVWQGYPLKAKDIIRAEKVSIGDLTDIAHFTSQQVTRPDMNVLLFSCDSITLSKYSPDELEAVYNAYR